MSSTQFNLQNLLDETLNDFFNMNTNTNSRNNIDLQQMNFPLYDICYSSLFNIVVPENPNSEMQNREEEVEVEEEEETKSTSGDSMPDLIPLDNTSNINSNINNNHNIEMSESPSQQLTLWANLLEDYNSQIQTYQQNIQSIIHITQELLPALRNRTNPTNINTTTTNNRPTTSPNSNRRNTLITQLRDWFRNNDLSSQSQYILEFENVTPLVFSNTNNRNTSSTNTSVYLTTQEIQSATELFINDASNNVLVYNTCPISLEDFRDGEPLMRINHCGHIFKAFELQRWFLRNTKCPSCRYDIRTQNII